VKSKANLIVLVEL